MRALFKGLLSFFKTPLILLGSAVGITTIMGVPLADMVDTFILIALGLFFIWLCFKFYKN